MRNRCLIYGVPITFAVSASYSTGANTGSLQVGDINGDGNADIVTQNYISNTSSSISLFIGRGNGTFNQATSINGGGTNLNSNHGLKLGDTNGDGILDIVESDYYDGSISVFIGRGNGTYNQRTSYAGFADFAVELGDYNNDGIVDVLSSSFGAPSFGVYLGNTKEGANPLLPFDLTTMAGARQALPVFDKKIQALAAQRGKIGSFQARIQVGINNLQSASENYAAAESRIRNADIADESSKLVRLNILQQAASSVLSQSNLQPQLALKLLQS